MRLVPWRKGLRPVLLACKDKQTISKIHALMILTGIFINGDCNGQLIATYSRNGNFPLARQVFDHSPQRGVDAWNAIIIAYSKMGSPNQVLHLYHTMILENVRPDSSTFTLAIKACASLVDLKTGEEIRHQAIEHGYGKDPFVESSVLNLYAKGGKMDAALEIFGKMMKRDLISWTTMITGLSQFGRGSEAIDIYRRMKDDGIVGDGVVMVGLIQACTSIGNSKMGLSIHGYMIRTNIHMDVVIQTSLVDMYAKKGSLETAFCVFGNMPHKNIISWSALISGLAQNGFAGRALEMLIEMQKCGFELDLVSLVSALLACSQIGLLKLGKSIHGYIVRRLHFDRVSGTAVIDMYSKCGALFCARSLFDRIKSRDSISWNAMISSYGIHGFGNEALSIFLQMIETNLRPDHATFASLFSAFSHSGLVKQGQYWFNCMIKEFNIQPSEKHFTCIVDLLARSGRVEDAYELIKTMNNEPGISIWVSLLSGCHKHRKFLIGDIAAKKVIESKSDDLGLYALISNFYADNKKWDEVVGVRRTMKKSGMKKVPGYSVLEVNGTFHFFLTEDKSHPQHEKILGVLEVLDFEMRHIGLVPTIEFVVQRS